MPLHCIAARSRAAVCGTALLATMLAGCRLPGTHGAESSSLLACRQLSQQGVSAMERQQWQKAEELLAEAVETCRTDAEARRHHAEALWNCNDQARAISEMAEAVRMLPDDPALRVRLAEMQSASGQLAMAYRGAELAIDMDPHLSAAWALRGRVMTRSGQPRQALADYQRALSYDPHNRQLLLEIAELYRQLDQPQLALVSLQNLADTHPPGEEPQDVLQLAGMAYMAMGRYSEAASCFNQACQRQPPDAEILTQLAEAQWRAGHGAAARHAAQQALTMQPDHAQALALLEELDGRTATAPAAPRR